MPIDGNRLIRLSLYQWLLLAAALSVFFSALFWLAIYLFRQWEIRKFKRAPLLFPNEQSRFADIDGIKLHYLVFGMGRDVVLLHGLGASLYCWRLVIPLLSKHFRVWAVDLKGFGCSDKPRNSPYGLQAQASLMLKFFESVNISSASVVGNSMGGAIAAEMAIQNSTKVPKVVLINSAHDPKIIRRLMWLDLRWLSALLVAPVAPLINRQTVKQFLKMLYGKHTHISNEIVDAYIAPYMKGLDAHWSFALALDSILEEGLTDRLKLCPAKILILWGQRDLLTPIKYGRSLHQEVKGSQFFFHATGGHHLQEEEPEWIAQHIINFA